MKYKNNAQIIYVPTISSENDVRLTEIAQGTKVYSDKSYDSELNRKLVQEISEESFTYGTTNESWGTTGNSNCQWSVPESITLNDGSTWKFSGYNMTIMLNSFLPIVYDNQLYDCIQFDTAPTSSSRWATSAIRKWMNGNDAVQGQKWKITQSDDSTRETPLNVVTGLLPRFPK